MNPPQATNNDDAAAEAADLEANTVSHEQQPADEAAAEDVSDQASDDLSEMFGEDFHEDYEDGEEGQVAPPKEVPEKKEEIVAEAPKEEVAAKEEVKEEEPQEASSEIVTREDALKMLQDANAELVRLRAENAEAPRVDAEQPQDQSVTDPTEIRTAALTHLQGEYAISEEDADAILVSPETVLPKMLAEQHLRVLESVTQIVRAQIPALIKDTAARETAVASWDQKFYEKWPALAEHKSEVAQAKRAVAQMYPNQSEEEQQNSIGSFLSIQHGIVPSAQDKPSSTSRPAAPRAVPHTPLGRGPVSKPAPATDNFYSGLAEEDEASNF